MAISVYQINQKLLSLLTLFSLLSLSHGRLNLDPSDSAALSAVIQALGLSTPSGSTPCSIPGVFCERRLFDDTTYVLRVTRLIFKSRGLTGVVSPAIGHLSELKELSLSNNNLVDHIPTQVCDCKKLEILDLASNQFNGEVPTNISSLVRLRFLDLSSNQLSGNLNFLTYFPNLESLSLASNLFSGKVPQSVRSFRNLRFFDFTENLLEEPVPLMDRVEAGKSSQYPKRFMLADSRNGAPARAPRPSKASSSGPTQAPSSSTSHHKQKNKKKKALAWILGFAVGAFAGSFTGFVFSVLLKLALSAVRGRRKDSGMAIFSPLIKKPEDLSFLEKEEGVASLEVIGKGGCGQVYKAQLPGENGRMIAIKKVLQPPKEAAELAEEDSKLLHKKMRQIRSEINTVGQIRHRNLLPLLAHIPRPDCHYLVYEFMKNGSLQDVLNQVRAGARELDWAARHKIALGVAAGLEYLHKHHSPPIVHRDLKPANVLLDDDMEARIADFGLAKAMPDAKTHFTTSNVAGTVGYIAPEYHQTLKFTDRCDIFSFGVLLGVLVVGKLPSDEFFQHTEEMNMVKWMRNVMSSDNPTRAIDEKLIGNGKEEQMLLFLKIACFCTLDNPKERPDSKNVRLMLSQIQP